VLGSKNSEQEVRVKSEKRKVKRSLTPNPSPKGEGSRIKDLKDLKGFLKPEP
jgi:hypothetical protein